MSMVLSILNYELSVLGYPLFMEALIENTSLHMVLAEAFSARGARSA